VPSIGHMLEAVPDSSGLAVLVPFERLKRVALQAETGFRISAREVASLWARDSVVARRACEIEVDMVDMMVDCSSDQQEGTG